MSNATENFSVGPDAAGWELVSPTALKVWLTLVHLGSPCGATAEQIGELAGVSDRTVTTVLQELGALGWLRYAAQRGEGVRWQIEHPPAVLKDEAVEHYKCKLLKEKERLQKKELRLQRAHSRSLGKRVDELTETVLAGNG